MKRTIKAQLAGRSYPSESGQILQYVRDFFDLEESPPWPAEADTDPHALPEMPGLIGIVAPHIELRVGEAAYAHAFEPLLRARPAAHYLILGVGHSCRLEWAVDGRPWATPLGTIPADNGLALELAASLGKEFVLDPLAFEHEHSIEFPLILLQALDRLRGTEPDFTIAPVLCGGLHGLLHGIEEDTYRQLLAAIARRLRTWFDRARADGGARIIVSIDGCHQGPRFDHPYGMTPERLRETHAWEENLWQHVERHDPDGLLSFLRKDKNARYFDGVGALMLLMEMFPEGLGLERTCYRQAYHPGDRSMVSFTSARVTQT